MFRKNYPEVMTPTLRRGDCFTDMAQVEELVFAKACRKGMASVSVGQGYLH